MADRSLLARRRRVLGARTELFYDEPLQLVRGRGVWLWDTDGRRYLDAYNNVPHVGHCHPAVVRAIAQQAATLNTHTRYLDATVVEYAQRLTSTFGHDLDAVLFTCSGSEANDVALRLARVATGNRGVLVSAHAYHGTTDLVTQVTTADPTLGARAPWVAPFQVPHQRSAAGPLEDVVDARLAQIATGIEHLMRAGHGVAALLVCSVFSSDGILEPPPRFMTGAAALVHDAGGLLIADEVQGGFGRTGGQMWGIDRFGVVPDVVTLGKPMGNGYPLAGIVTRRPLLQHYRDQVDYFNTFAGTPVAAAAGGAVLDVMEEEDLMARASHVGRKLATGLERLATAHPCVGGARGTGLFLGLELVTGRGSRLPAPDLAHRVVNGMRAAGVLIGHTGPERNILKIRPPLVFEAEHGDILLDRLDRTLADL